MYELANFKLKLSIRKNRISEKWGFLSPEKLSAKILVWNLNLRSVLYAHMSLAEACDII